MPRRVAFDIFANDQVSRTFERIAVNTRDLKAKLDRITAKAVNLQIDADDASARAKMLALQAKLAELGKKTARPNLDVAGQAKAMAELEAINAQLDAFGRKDETAHVTVDSDPASRGIDRIMAGLVALAPAVAPATAAVAGGIAGITTALAGAAAGVGAFGAVATQQFSLLKTDLKALEDANKKANTAQDAYDQAVKADGKNSAQAREAAQKLVEAKGAVADINAEMTPGERELADATEALKNQWDDFLRSTMGFTAKPIESLIGLMQRGLPMITPLLKATSGELAHLEDELTSALGSPYWQHFFTFLAGRASKDLESFGHDLGHIATGFAGLMQAFSPLADDMEGGLERLTGKFADFGRTAGQNQGLQDFIGYVEKEGPQLLHVLGQLTTTLVDIGKAAAPIGGAEIKVFSDFLGIVDRLVRDQPGLAQAAIAMLTISKATKALTGFTVLGALGKLAAGRALGKLATDAGEAGTGAGLFAGSLARLAPWVARLANPATGLVALGAGVAYVSYKIATAGSAYDGYYKSLAQTDRAVGNNVRGYEKLSQQAGTLSRANHALAVQSSFVGLSQQQVAAQQAKAIAGWRQNQYAVEQNSKKLRPLLSNLGLVQSQTGLTQRGVVRLANSLGIDLTKKSGTSAANLARMHDKLINDKLAAQQTAGPVRSVAIATQILADKSSTASQKLQAVSNELDALKNPTNTARGRNLALGNALDQVRDASSKNVNVQRILSGRLVNANTNTRNLASALDGARGQFLDNTKAAYDNAQKTGGVGAAAKAARDQQIHFRDSLEKTLQKMGLSKSAAERLADSYSKLPRNITTVFRKTGDGQLLQFTSNLKAHLDHLTQKSWEINVNGTVGSISGKFGQAPIAEASGGYIAGPGTGTSDSIPARLSNGEYVVNAASTKMFRPLLESINARRFAAGGIVDVLMKASTPSLGGVESRLDTLIRKMGQSFGGFGAGGTGGFRSLGRRIAQAMGVLGQFGAIDYIFTRESGWNPNAQNPTSSAFGIPQFLNPTWAAYGGKTRNPAIQIEDGIRYMIDRYGSPNGAAAFWRGHHWYDTGGWLQPGVTMAYNGTGKPERVLPPGPLRVKGGTITLNMQGVGKLDAHIEELILDHEAFRAGR